MSKKGLSPVIATVLLISLVLVLATIIFLWARSFIPESVQKFQNPVADACKDVAFSAEYSNGMINIQNNGNVPIYSIDVGVKSGIGSLEYISVSQPSTIIGGSLGHFSLADSGNIAGKELIIVPILLGKNINGELRSFACPNENAETIQA